MSDKTISGNPDSLLIDPSGKQSTVVVKKTRLYFLPLALFSKVSSGAPSYPSHIDFDNDRNNSSVLLGGRTSLLFFSGFAGRHFERDQGWLPILLQFQKIFAQQDDLLGRTTPRQFPPSSFIITWHLIIFVFTSYHLNNRQHNHNSYFGDE